MDFLKKGVPEGIGCPIEPYFQLDNLSVLMMLFTGSYPEIPFNPTKNT